LSLDHFRIRHLLDADGHGILFGQLRGAIPPRSEDNLKPCFRDRSHKQGRENALAADGCGQLSQRVLLEGAARIGLRLG
jgi:hypothetical protein